MEGERRTVTMLFADIQGSTSSAEKLDPEDWADIMNGAFERLIAPIYRYEGTLAQLRGDSILAFFGAPIAHEDDPVRALRAGLEMVAAMAEYGNEVEGRWGVPAHVRVGVNTGLVVVGAMGSDLRVEYSALGDAINVAARMEQTAEPDTVRVTEHTLSLTKGMFEAEELGPIEVKGKSEPVSSHRVLRYIGGQRGGEAIPLVGRTAELERLDDLGQKLVAGTGNIVSIIGEAGVGKTRLLAEMTRRTGEAFEIAHRFDEQGDLNWLNGSSRSYDSGNHFSTIADMFGQWWFTDPSMPDFDVIQAAVDTEGVDDPDMAAFLAYIGGFPLSDGAAGFIGALETQVLNTKANNAALTYLAAVAERRPTVLVLEDLHWADDLSLALVEGMMTLTEKAPLGLVLTMRPYRDEPTWRIHEVAERDHHHRYLRVTLDPLEMAESTALLDSLLSGEDLSPSAREAILSRSEGNPLYIEQMVRAMMEQGTDRVDEVPSSLSGLLTARLDRLDERERYLVQMASVFGSEFDRSALIALLDDPDVDDRITDLLKRGIFTELPGRAETLGFRHALIQEVAYETILRRTRRDLHQRVADHLIAAAGGSREIARHLIAAGHPKTAYPYLIDAGLAATRAMALADAIELLTTATENTPDGADPELIFKAHEGLGEAYSLIPDLSQAAVSYQRLYEFGESTHRPQAQVAALNRLAYATASLGADLEGADAYLADARRIAEENDDDIGLAEYHMNACFVSSMRGDIGTAVAHDEETVRLGEQAGVPSIRLMGLVRRATNYISLLDFEHGLPAIESALKEAKEVGADEGVAIVEYTRAIADLLKGEIREALDRATRAHAALERYGSFYLAMNRNIIAQCHLELGNVEDALASQVDTVRHATTGGQPFAVAAGSSGMALVYATLGLEDRVPALRADATRALQQPNGELYASTVHADLGFAALELGEDEQASADFTTGLGVSSGTQFSERPRLLVGRSLTRMASGDTDGARDDLEKARSLVADKGLSLYEALIAFAVGLLETARGDDSAATKMLVQAQEEAMSRGQRLMLVTIERQRATLAALAGDSDEAASHVASARTAVDAIAEGIADDVLASSFRDKWLFDVGSLTSETSR